MDEKTTTFEIPPPSPQVYPGSLAGVFFGAPGRGSAFYFIELFKASLLGSESTHYSIGSSRLTLLKSCPMNEGSFLEMHRTGRRYWWYQAREKLMERLLDEYHHKPLTTDVDSAENRHSERIADIGCGTGTMFDFLAQRGRVLGIEPVKSAIVYAASHKSALLVQATSDCLPVKSKSMDVVGMFDCLEHMGDDLTALREARRIISDSGVLLITAPAFPWLISRREKQLGHKRRYSKSMLHQVLSQAGFQISFMKYMYATLFPLLVLKMLKDKLTPIPSHERSDIAMLSEPWNSILANWFRGEAFICEKWGLPFGTSIACVAHPKNAVEKKLENRETAA